MNEILLTHYYHKDFVPFRSISSYNKKTKDTVFRLSQLSDKAYGRFRNYEWYFTQRKETEQWLLQSFIDIGGIPKITSPIYFILGNSEYMQSCFGEDVKTYQIGLDKIDEKEVSFTLSDSMSIHVSGEEKKVLTKKDMLLYVENQGATLFDYIIKADKIHQYIEAQLWNNSYFAK